MENVILGISTITSYREDRNELYSYAKEKMKDHLNGDVLYFADNLHRNWLFKDVENLKRFKYSSLSARTKGDIEVEGKITLIVNSIEDFFINSAISTKFINSSIDHKVIFMGEDVEEFYEFLFKFKDNLKSLKKIKKKLEKMKGKRDSAKDKDIKKLIQEKVKDLNVKLTMAERSCNLQSFKEVLGYSYIAFSQMILKYDIEYISKNMIIIDLNLHNDVAEEYYSDTSITASKLVKKYIKKSLEKKENVLVSDEFDLLIKHISYANFNFHLKSMKTITTFNEIKGFISEQVDIDISDTISMSDTKPVAPVKPNIAASIVASGSVGSLNKDVLINKDEPAQIKSIMSQDISSIYIIINGIKRMEKIYVWKSKLGIFNKLRKEIEIISD